MNTKIKAPVTVGLIVVLTALAFFMQRNRPPQAPFPTEKLLTSSKSRGGRSPASAGPNRRTRGTSVLFKARKNLSSRHSELLQRKLSALGLRQAAPRSASGLFRTASRTTDARLSPAEIAESLMATGTVEYAEPDYLIEPSFVPNDAFVSSQWHLDKISAYNTWNITTGSSSIKVAVCDTGVESTHPDLAANLILPGYNSEDRAPANLAPIHPHGTMVAGIIAGIGNNQIGISGIAPKVRLIPIKISNLSDGAAYLSAMTHCIEYAADQGAKVVSLSYPVGDSPAVDAAAQYLRSKGGLLVVAAGNDGIDLSSTPDYGSSITVGASDHNDFKTSWSNYGTPIDMVAPGTQVLTTTLNGTYVYGDGTSFSTPLVSGAAALIYSLKPLWTPDQVESLLYSTATKVNNRSEAEFGKGRLNVYAAVAQAGQAAPSPSPSPFQADCPFIEADYLFLNPDVASAVAKGRFSSGYAHYISNGKKEGRRYNRTCDGSGNATSPTPGPTTTPKPSTPTPAPSPSPSTGTCPFIEADYLYLNPDVAAAVARGQFKSGYAHFQSYGKKEGRPFNRTCSGNPTPTTPTPTPTPKPATPTPTAAPSPGSCPFIEADYLALNPDVATAVAKGRFSSGYAHYQSYGRKEGRRFNRTCNTPAPQ